MGTGRRLTEERLRTPQGMQNHCSLYPRLVELSLLRQRPLPPRLPLLLQPQHLQALQLRKELLLLQRPRLIEC